MPRVYSKRKGAEPAPEGAVYVGRPTQFGNPFVIQPGLNTQEEAVAAYRDWLETPEGSVIAVRAKRELRGKDLVCWCKARPDDPTPCHADVLLEVANG